ncbi:MAG TPA: aspartate aminotransferase family protein [Candidatus Acidoferrum sp.]|nr:aspartate aminotransferase family protein [Candidatus Acidoferrum sp.]
MNAAEIQGMEDAHGAKVYAKKPVVIVRGSGVLVYDLEGNEYVDCAGGYGTCIVGHTHPKVVAAISEQAAKLISCHGSTYNDARARLFSKLLTIAPKELDRFFLSNSGAEANECAIKISRKFTGRRKIVAFKGGFHGKTHGALSATWDAKYRKSFEPLLPDFTHIPYGNSEAAKTEITKDTAAVLVEPIQGEGGIRPSPIDWLPLLKDLTRDTGALLVADEIQSGFGRTGKMFACEHYGVKPDILCIGKGIASGLPLSITATDDEKMGALQVGEHTTTFGGNPIVCAAAVATIDALHDDHLVSNAAKIGLYLKNELLNVQKQLRIVREVRGMGLMIGVEMRFDVYPILTSALSQGILMLDAGRNVLRFLPPLVIDQSTVDRVVSGLRTIMEKEQLAKLPS